MQGDGDVGALSKDAIPVVSILGQRILETDNVEILHLARESSHLVETVVSLHRIDDEVKIGRHLAHSLEALNDLHPLCDLDLQTAVATIPSRLCSVERMRRILQTCPIAADDVIATGTTEQITHPHLS